MYNRSTASVFAFKKQLWVGYDDSHKDNLYKSTICTKARTCRVCVLGLGS